MNIAKQSLLLLLSYLLAGAASLSAQTEYASIKSSLSVAASAGFSKGPHSSSASGFGLEFSPHEMLAIGAARAEGQGYYKDADEMVDFKAAEAYIKILGRRMEGKPIAMTLTLGYLSYYKSSHGYLLPKNYMMGLSVFRDFDFTSTSKIALYPEIYGARIFNRAGATAEFGFACTLRIGGTRRFGLLVSPTMSFSEGDRVFSVNAAMLFAN